MISELVTFVIPVRHPANAKDWTEEMRRLAQTVCSIAAQTDDRWRAVIVANREATLPPLPDRFSVEWVDFPPNAHHDRAGVDLETFDEAVRLDKGRRILAGLLGTRLGSYVMIVDDDDFVSQHLVAFVAQHPTENGWYFNDGYVWRDGGTFVYRCSDFSRLCGTSHIIRTDLYALPPDAASASTTYVKRMLGSHIFIESHLAETGTPLAPLPFRGAVYRIGHRGSHTQSPGLRGEFFGRELLRRPGTLFSRLVLTWDRSLGR